MKKTFILILYSLQLSGMYKLQRGFTLPKFENKFQTIGDYWSEIKELTSCIDFHLNGGRRPFSKCHYFRFDQIILDDLLTDYPQIKDFTIKKLVERFPNIKSKLPPNKPTLTKTKTDEEFIKEWLSEIITVRQNELEAVKQFDIPSSPGIITAP
ncbi:MAG: hypothetical protein ACTSR2_07285 [Candidatus Hodarchaeales archaeon]